ncbi:MAG TPA: hypothetical protein VIM14_09700 [Polyangia bacterium]
MGFRSGHLAKACFLVLAGVAFSLVAGCYDNPTTKVDSMICKTDQQCPVGYACKIPGVKGGCQKDETGLDGGASEADATVDANTPIDGETAIDAGHALDGAAGPVD